MTYQTAQTNYCSDYFADDTNIFYSSGSARDLETVVNQELTKILEYCAANKLSINFKKNKLYANNIS